MALLKPPPRSPEYRQVNASPFTVHTTTSPSFTTTGQLRVQGRAHGDFLVRLKDVMDDRQAVLRGVGEALERLGFVVQVRLLE